MAIMTFNNNGGAMVVPTDLVYCTIELLGSDAVWWLLPPPSHQKLVEKRKGV